LGYSFKFYYQKNLKPFRFQLEGEFVMQKQINLKIPLSASRGLPLALGAFVLGGGLLKSNGKIVG
jgi:hypothetical protein